MMRNYLHYDFSIILVLVLLFLLIRIPILFTFQGILGGDETNYIPDLLRLLEQGRFDAFWYYCKCGINAYFVLSALLQTPVFAFFYLLFPTNEMNIFFSALAVNTFILISLYLILSRFNGKRAAVYAALLFILSPIGFTITTISFDNIAGNFYISGFLLALIFLYRSKKKGMLVVFIILPLLSPYYFLLWPCFVIYILLQKYFERDQGAFKDFFKIAVLMKYKKYIIPGILILLGNIYILYLLFRSGRIKILFFTRERFADYFHYIKQPFVASGIENLDALSAVTHSAFYIFMFLVVCGIFEILRTTFSERKVSPLLLPACFCLIFLAAELLVNNHFFDYRNRVLVIRVQHLTLIITIGMIIIASVVAKRKKLRIVLFILLSLNLITNLSTITTPQKNNNFVNYNTGIANFTRLRKMELSMDGMKASHNKKVLESLASGIRSRETEPFRLAERDIDYRLYGYGMHIFYNNVGGINFCNILPDGEKRKACEEGYGMTENGFKLYLEDEY